MGYSRISGTWHAQPGPGLLLLGLLLLPALVAFASTSTGAEPVGEDLDVRCMCAKTHIVVHPKYINSLEVIRAGPHCPVAQMIATLKSGVKICLDHHAAKYKKIIKKLLSEK
ncbi:platelet factor 4 [Echinops telfairi]|uniref:Platelet factor 4 n=1 Tax=Echinops telfairi TaxID=9371 RepID=A0ABM0IMF6_ECHTE|nr:platelet factor 4 [Echinops telfairi]